LHKFCAFTQAGVTLKPHLSLKLVSPEGKKRKLCYSPFFLKLSHRLNYPRILCYAPSRISRFDGRDARDARDTLREQPESNRISRFDSTRDSGMLFRLFRLFLPNREIRLRNCGVSRSLSESLGVSRKRSNPKNRL